jgi:hypothetical protein
MRKKAIKKTAITKVSSCFFVFVILMSVVPVSVLAVDGSFNATDASSTGTLSDGNNISFVSNRTGNRDIFVMGSISKLDNEQPSPKITAVEIDPPTCVKEGESATITVTFKNIGGPSSIGYISVSFPHDETIIDVSGTGDKEDIYQKGSDELWGKHGKMESSKYPLAELTTFQWGEGQERTLIITVKPNSGSDKIVFYVRAALKNDADGSYERDPTSSDYRDQQEWAVYRYSMDTCNVYPNLIITDIDPDENDKKIYYTIKNIGGITAGPSYSYLYIDDMNSRIASDSVSHLGVNKERELYFEYSYTCYGDSDTIKVCADGKVNNVIEADETDNCKTITKECGSNPESLIVAILDPEDDFSVVHGVSEIVKAKVTDNFGNPVSGLTVKATFTNGDAELTLFDDGAHGDGSAKDEVYANTWTPQTTAQGYTETACTITVIGSHGTLSQGTAYVSGKLISTPVSITNEDFGITPPTRNYPAKGPITAGIEDKIGILYSIKNTDTSNRDVKLITKIRNQDTGEIIPDPTNDKVVTLAPSDTMWYSRSFVIPSGTKAGTYDVLYSIYKPDQSDIYDETWKAGWLIVDTDTYTVSLRSSANDGSLNIGSIRVDTTTHNLPSEVTKQYRMNEYYYVEAIAPTGYNFDRWETIGGVSVNDIGNGFGILSVTGAGTLNAVLKKAPTFKIILDPSSIILNPGEKGTTLVIVKSLNGFSGSVELGLGWDEASGNWFSNVNFDPKIVALTSGGEQVTSELSFDLSGSATPGVYNMHVGATDLQRLCQSKYENLQLSVKGTKTQDPVLENWEITPTMAKAGDTVELHYYLYNPNTHSLDVTLGVTMRDSDGHEMVDKTNDIDVTVTPGRNWYKRSFVIDANANSGYYDVLWGIHKAHLAGRYDKSGWLDNRLKITTAKTLDDLLDAEQMLYEDVKKTIGTQTRQVIADYALFDKAFNFEAADSAVEILLKTEYALIKVPLISGSLQHYVGKLGDNSNLPATR